ncbi:hypothetical protein LC040_02355 [Bacillus tianshenii]|nr:hypothetical protein LC040_02355 [Bacillus tianshenii]
MNKLYFFAMITVVILSGCQAENRFTNEMDKTISSYILEYNQSVYTSTDVQFEAHKVYGASEENGTISVYLYSLYQGFNRETKAEAQSGHSMPLLIKLQKDGNSYQVIDYIEPMNGDYYKESINEMFPKKYARQALSETGNASKLKNEIKTKVEEWLKRGPK